MADLGNQLAGNAVNMGAGRALGELGLRSPVPLPSFYNPNSTSPFANSQFNQMIHGNPQAISGYGKTIAGGFVGNLIVPGLGGMVGARYGPQVIDWASSHLHNLLNGKGWSGNTPTGTVTVGDIESPGGSNAAGPSGPSRYDSSMPMFTGGNQSWNMANNYNSSPTSFGSLTGLGGNYNSPSPDQYVNSLPVFANSQAGNGNGNGGLADHSGWSYGSMMGPSGFNGVVGGVNNKGFSDATGQSSGTYVVYHKKPTK